MTTPETPTLLPCPFCGTEAQMNRTWGYWHVMCRSDVCVVQRMSNGFDTETEAAAAWNTRHPDPATLALARLGATVVEGRDGIDLSRIHNEAYSRLIIAWHTPGIRERVAELLQDTEARERREDTDNA
jgi:hypothetical protein